MQSQRDCAQVTGEEDFFYSEHRATGVPARLLIDLKAVAAVSAEKLDVSAQKLAAKRGRHNARSGVGIG